MVIFIIDHIDESHLHQKFVTTEFTSIETVDMDEYICMYIYSIRIEPLPTLEINSKQINLLESGSGWIRFHGIC